MTDEKWMPEVGQEYRHHNGAVYKVDEITNLATTNPDKFPIMVSYTRVDHGTKWSRPLEDWMQKFRPIQSAADKYRDEQVDELESLLCHQGLVDANSSGKYLYNQGVRVLRDGEFVASKLSDYQKHELCADEAMLIEHVEAVERAMRGE